MMLTFTINKLNRTLCNTGGVGSPCCIAPVSS